MQKFVYYAPTEIVFGKDAELKTAELVKKHGGSRVLVIYGGKSAVKSPEPAVFSRQDLLKGRTSEKTQCLLIISLRQDTEIFECFYASVGGLGDQIPDADTHRNAHCPSVRLHTDVARDDIPILKPCGVDAEHKPERSARKAALFRHDPCLIGRYVALQTKILKAPYRDLPAAGLPRPALHVDKVRSSGQTAEDLLKLFFFYSECSDQVMTSKVCNYDRQLRNAVLH